MININDSIYYVGSIPCPSGNALIHFGIKNQKWGVRRFRNPDGTLTAAGKARYAKSTGRKSAQDMSDEELAAAVRRLKNEAEWQAKVKDLDKKPESNLKKGAKAVGKVLGTIGKVALAPAISEMSKKIGAGIGDALVQETVEQRQRNEAARQEREAARREAREQAAAEARRAEEAEVRRQEREAAKREALARAANRVNSRELVRRRAEARRQRRHP